jgi:hypothetical protein
MTSGVNYKGSDTVGVAASGVSLASGVSNKPMVPTAPTSLNRYSLPSRRRHIGQPFGSPQGQGWIEISGRQLASKSASVSEVVQTGKEFAGDSGQ